MSATAKTQAGLDAEDCEEFEEDNLEIANKTSKKDKKVTLLVILVFV